MDEASESVSPRVLWTLRIAVAITCLGTGWHDLLQEGPLFSALWMGFGWSEATALAIHRAGAWALLASIPLVLWRRGWPALLFVSLWMFFKMVAEAWDGVWHPELVPIEWAVLYVGPLAVAALTLGHVAPAVVALRVAAAATFFGHGLAAGFHNAQFIDLIIVGSRDLVAVDVADDTARSILTVIAILDVLLATTLILPVRLRWVALWMAFWGLVTAFSRLIRLGPEGWLETAMRALNAGVPLALFLYWTSTFKEKKDAR